ncbi:omega-hydroxypalmitate O-feruloyl transferase [Olea europaea subsp. europaea]|uniref:Omega-hydroxypalmitate O-feruloyl transferase n=1 Tax=Olea europaea subsp. europaea TaxID=158383 RepID=A0A8S0UE89_OLEEU|nr:omega-hydroxypalmitate O-feruloyl transferase [Olea europaea subsp. europaea]
MEYTSGHAAEGGFSVRKLEPVQVVPTGKTPEGLYLLSNLDQTFPYPIEIVFAFNGNGTNINNPSEILKTSLAKILQVLYPFAGCLDTSWDGKIIVNCTGHSVLFVEPYSEDEMEVLGDLTIIDPLKLRKLIHFEENVKNILDVKPLTVQVYMDRMVHTFLNAESFSMYIPGVTLEPPHGAVAPPVGENRNQ